MLLLLLRSLAPRCQAASDRPEDPAKDLGGFILSIQLRSLLEDPAKDLGGFVRSSQLCLDSWVVNLALPTPCRHRRMVSLIHPFATLCAVGALVAPLIGRRDHGLGESLLAKRWEKRWHEDPASCRLHAWAILEGAAPHEGGIDLFLLHELDHVCRHCLDSLVQASRPSLLLNLMPNFTFSALPLPFFLPFFMFELHMPPFVSGFSPFLNGEVFLLRGD